MVGLEFVFKLRLELLAILNMAIRIIIVIYRADFKVASSIKPKTLKICGDGDGEKCPRPS